jgi:hypothetical protein
MDLREAIEDLRRQKEKLENTIALLEELQRALATTLETKPRRKRLVKPRPPENLDKDNG